MIASWTWQTLACPPDLPRQVNPSFGLPEGRLPRHFGCKHPKCRPADRSQPAIELSEPASHVLYLGPCRFRRNPAQTGHELQRPSWFEVALVSRVSFFRARGLKAFAKALSLSICRSVNLREPIYHDSLTTSAQSTRVVYAVLSTGADRAVDGANLSA